MHHHGGQGPAIPWYKRGNFWGQAVGAQNAFRYPLDLEAQIFEGIDVDTIDWSQANLPYRILNDNDRPRLPVEAMVWYAEHLQRKLDDEVNNHAATKQQRDAAILAGHQLNAVLQQRVQAAAQAARENAAQEVARLTMAAQHDRWDLQRLRASDARLQDEIRRLTNDLGALQNQHALLTQERNQLLSEKRTLKNEKSDTSMVKAAIEAGMTLSNFIIGKINIGLGSMAVAHEKYSDQEKAWIGRAKSLLENFDQRRMDLINNEVQAYQDATDDARLSVADNNDGLQGLHVQEAIDGLLSHLQGHDDLLNGVHVKGYLDRYNDLLADFDSAIDQLIAEINANPNGIFPDVGTLNEFLAPFRAQKDLYAKLVEAEISKIRNRVEYLNDLQADVNAVPATDPDVPGAKAHLLITELDNGAQILIDWARASASIFGRINADIQPSSDLLARINLLNQAIANVGAERNNLLAIKAGHETEISRLSKQIDDYDHDLDYVPTVTSCPAVPICPAEKIVYKEVPGSCTASTTNIALASTAGVMAVASSVLLGLVIRGRQAGAAAA